MIRQRICNLGETRKLRSNSSAAEPKVCDVIPYYMLMLDRCGAKRNNSITSSLHFHIDYLHFPLFRVYMSSPVLTTLHGRQDLPDNKPIYIGFDEMRLISISDSQRIPISIANFAKRFTTGYLEQILS